MSVDPTADCQGVPPPLENYFFVYLLTPRGRIRYADIVYAVSEIEAVRRVFYNFLGTLLVQKHPVLLDQTGLMHIKSKAWNMAWKLVPNSSHIITLGWDHAMRPILRFELKKAP